MPTIGRGGMRLECSRAAERDLDDLLTFGTARFGDSVADEYYFSFDAAFALIRNHPRIGEAIDAVEPGVRKLTHRNHRIFYEIDDDRVRILRILHHAMDIDGHL
jgi:toxin ParE1/3/4